MSLLARCLWCLCLCISLSAGPLVCQTTSTEERAGLGRRFLTVADAIRTTRLADAEYRGGTPSTGRVAQFSPDGKRFAIVLVKGNLESNTNEFSMVLYETSNAFAGPRPNILLRMSSSSNRPAISRIKWLEDNDTITFLGEKIGELPQVYALHAATRRLNQLTHHPSSASNSSCKGRNNRQFRSQRKILFSQVTPISLFLRVAAMPWFALGSEAAFLVGGLTIKSQQFVIV